MESMYKKRCISVTLQLIRNEINRLLWSALPASAALRYLMPMGKNFRPRKAETTKKQTPNYKFSYFSCTALGLGSGFVTSIRFK